MSKEERWTLYEILGWFEHSVSFLFEKAEIL